jgi:hypothetical protein
MPGLKGFIYQKLLLNWYKPNLAKKTGSKIRDSSTKQNKKRKTVPQALRERGGIAPTYS